MIPPKKLTGTNTAAKTKDVAISALVSPSIALCVAAWALRCSSSINRSTFSTTTIASSTTIPMANTSPNKVSILSEISIIPNVPIKDIGTAMMGINVDLQL